jgi:hypothetical protein
VGPPPTLVAPHLLIQVIDTGAWKSFVTPNGVPVQPESFRQFVTDERYKGLGATPEKIAAILGDNNDAVVKMRELLKGKTGPKTADNSGNNVTPTGRATVTGNRRDYTLDRLTRERPDLRDHLHRGRKLLMHW